MTNPKLPFDVNGPADYLEALAAHRAATTYAEFKEAGARLLANPHYRWLMILTEEEYDLGRDL